jgi:hypothetical protein
MSTKDTDNIKKMSGEEIIKYLTDNTDICDFQYLNGHKALGKCKKVDDVEQTSGEAWVINYFIDHDVYIRHNGFYNSYDSCSEYSDHDYDVVEPYQAVVTLYESVRK